jgi:hypothetical protein
MHWRLVGLRALLLAAAAGLAASCSHLSPAPPGDAAAQQASGTLVADTVWSGRVEISDDVLVPPGRTLRIRAGTRVAVRPADTTKTEPQYLDNATELLVRGRLLVEGTAESPVTFEALPGDPAAAADAATARWGGIIFDRGEGAVSHCRITGAETGVTMVAASPRLTDVTVDEVRQGIAIHGAAAPVLTRVRVRAAEGGIFCWPGSSPQFDAVDAAAGEHEGLLVAPGARPRFTACRFGGPVAGVLWGAGGTPPRDQFGDATVRVVAAEPEAAPREPAWPFPPPVVRPKASPDRTYQGEQFIGEDTTWEGEILIDGTVMVAPVAHLTVAPGTVVRFVFRDSDGDGIGESELFVQGLFTAVGTRERPIVFTAAGAAGPGRWGAINLMGSEDRENTLAYCLVESSFRGLHSHFSRFRVEHAVFRGHYRAIQFQESKAVLEDCVVTGSSNGMRFRDSTVALEGLAVTGNTSGIQMLRSTFSLSRSTVSGNALAGLLVRESEGTISGCAIEGNAPGLRVSDSRLNIEGNRVVANNGGGLLLRRSTCRVEGNRIAGSRGNGVSTDSAGTVLHGNVVAGSLRFAVENNAADPVDAAGNWWGPGGPSPELFFDRGDDPRLGPVLTAPPLAAPPEVP